MWRVNRIGKIQVWYSEEEYNELLKSIKGLEDKIFYLEQDNQVYKETYLEWCEQQRKSHKGKKK